MKIDLHMHSTLSHDGGITEEEFVAVLEEQKLDVLAITDHNEIDFAKALNRMYPNKVIVGEEIYTRDGEIIGLFLQEKIQANLSAVQTISEIKAQGGLVYLPHPFDKRRSALKESEINKNLDNLDIVEVFNARTYGRKSNKIALEFYEQRSLKSSGILAAVGSDAHSVAELCKTYNESEEKLLKLTPQWLLAALENVSFAIKPMSANGFLSPKLNKFKKWVRPRR